jgi:hypothetical protein
LLSMEEQCIYQKTVFIMISLTRKFLELSPKVNTPSHGAQLLKACT